MHDEDFLAVGLGEVLELRAHAVEVEAVERDADIVHVDFLDDRPSLTERIDGSCRMADELYRDAHAVFCCNRAHFLETFDCRFVDFLARDLLEVDRRHRDDRLAADLLAPLAHLTEFLQDLLVILRRAVIEEAQRVEGQWLHLVVLEPGCQLINRVVLEIVGDAVHRARLDHVVAVFLAEFEIFFQTGFFQAGCLIHAEFHRVHAPFLYSSG